MWRPLDKFFGKKLSTFVVRLFGRSVRCESDHKYMYIYDFSVHCTVQYRDISSASTRFFARYPLIAGPSKTPKPNPKKR